MNIKEPTKSSRKGFTLIELLIVVAIIGILAAVGAAVIPNLLTGAKIKATTENHNRMRDFANISFVRCESGAPYIEMKYSYKNTGFYNCTNSAYYFSTYFYEHFKFSSWKNPYNENEECCWKDKSTTPPKGRTYFWPIGNTVRMVTNIGNKDGGDEYLTSSFTKY